MEVTFGPVRSLGTPPDCDWECVMFDIFVDGKKVSTNTTDRESVEGDKEHFRLEYAKAPQSP